MLRGWALTASIKGENMKASFTFTLPEEQEEYEMMSHANDYRRAKENYRLAIENAKKSPDFPQKADMIKFAGDQLGRLKHS